MAKLYFEDYNEKRTFLTEVEVDFENNNPYINVIEFIHKDLKTRMVPYFNCRYIRWWADENNEIVFDFSSHREFYILKI